jgi:hypothetical protein
MIIEKREDNISAVNHQYKALVDNNNIKYNAN